MDVFSVVAFFGMVEILEKNTSSRSHHDRYSSIRHLWSNYHSTDSDARLLIEVHPRGVQACVLVGCKSNDFISMIRELWAMKANGKGNRIPVCYF